MKTKLLIIVFFIISLGTYGQTTKKSIPYFEKCIINKTDPLNSSYHSYGLTERSIMWSEKFSDRDKYSKEELNLLNYYFVEIAYSDNEHMGAIYRNCTKTMFLEIVYWYDLKVVVSLTWMPKEYKNQNIYLRWCN